MLPAAVNTTPGVSAALPFGNTPLVATGPVTLSFTATGASLSWADDANLKVSSGGDPVSGASGNALSLYGTTEQINAYLAAGKVNKVKRSNIMEPLSSKRRQGQQSGGKINKVEARSTKWRQGQQSGGKFDKVNNVEPKSS
jgi:hypothetical protein